MKETRYLKDNIQNIKQLFSIPALQHFETRNLAKLVRLSKIRQYDNGEYIIREGDTDPWLYFLLSGAVRIEKNGIEITRLDRMGEIFGEMRILDSLSRSASVVAIGQTVTLAVNTSATERLESEDEIANFLLLLYKVFSEYMSIRLRLSNDELIKAKREINHLKAQ